ncbi:MAG: hypothetical protein HY028_02730 [Gammaproteobacteria bacterium]|nr:hypothetical protein [Gammaproteobacteria bacterium]
MIKVLIFTAPYGEGHRSATEALASHLREHYPTRVQVQVVDYFETFTPAVAWISAYLYRRVTTYWPWAWGAFFAMTDRLSASRASRLLNLMALGKARRFLRAHRPDIVISTYPICGQVASELQREMGHLSATVVTDFGVHSQWVHPATDLYFVGADAVKEAVIGKGISRERIEVTGIPVRASFSLPVDREKARSKHRMSGAPVFLLSGGGWGMAYIETLSRRLAPLPIQLLVLCGKNAHLLSRIERLSQHFPNILPLGFVPDRMVELLSLSDLMIGKAGGLTVSEALCTGLPMLLYRPIPGQEVFNADFLVNEGAALWARDEADLVSKAAFLARRPDRLAQLRENAARLGRPRAAEEVCEKTLEKWQALSGRT